MPTMSSYSFSPLVRMMSTGTVRIVPPNYNCYIIRQHQQQQCRYASTSTTSGIGDNNTLAPPANLFPGNDDENYVKLLTFDNRERFLQCIQNRKLKSQKEPATTTRYSQQQPKLASVLIAICTDENGKNPSLLYTRRSRQLRRHMLQISFPGGNNEKDEDAVECALRETNEEIGLPQDRVEIWGKGHQLRTSPSAASPVPAVIMPVIGVVRNFRIEELTINESEVEEAFQVPIKHLNNIENCSYTQFRNGYTSPVFRLDKQVKIWGITGFLTRMFLNCLLPPEQNNISGQYKYIRPYPANTSNLPPSRSSVETPASSDSCSSSSSSSTPSNPTR